MKKVLLVMFLFVLLANVVSAQQPQQYATGITIEKSLDEQAEKINKHTDSKVEEALKGLEDRLAWALQEYHSINTEGMRTVIIWGSMSIFGIVLFTNGILGMIRLRMERNIFLRMDRNVEILRKEIISTRQLLEHAIDVTPKETQTNTPSKTIFDIPPPPIN